MKYPSPETLSAQIIATVLGLVLALTSPLSCGAQDHARGFSFALLGDMPYGVGDLEAFEYLINDINSHKDISFVAHVGDIKGGGEPCNNALINKRFDLLQKLRGAFIYTPGDNEWTDCHREKAGGYDPIERLDHLRRLFYPVAGQSTGPKPITIEQQSAKPEFSDFVENFRFTRAGVVIATVHISGSNNGLAPWSDPTTRASPQRQQKSFHNRRDAALAWLEETFTLAKNQRARAALLLVHANPLFELAYEHPKRRGYRAITERLGALSRDFKRPVALIHGDHHVFIHDRPLTKAKPEAAPNLVRVQTFGSPIVQWLKVHVDPDTEEVFQFEKRIPPQAGSDENIP